jgi:hypothetical protein
VLGLGGKVYVLWFAGSSFVWKNLYGEADLSADGTFLIVGKVKYQRIKCYDKILIPDDLSGCDDEPGEDD